MTTEAGDPLDAATEAVKSKDFAKAMELYARVRVIENANLLGCPGRLTRRRLPLYHVFGPKVALSWSE